MSNLKILIKSPRFMFGVVMILLIVCVAIAVPVLNPVKPTKMVARKYQPPSQKLVLGSDNFGRDMFLELAHGTRTSLKVGIVAGLIATAIGLFVGLLAGFIGGRLDDILTMITNMFIVVPSFVVLILVSVALDSVNTMTIAAIIGFTAWPWTARAVRSQTTSLRNRDHVNMARISGRNVFQIILMDILPYIASYVVMAFILQIAAGILSEASISMLGLGDRNAISLGMLMNWAMQFEAPANGYWWAFIPTTAMISLTTFSLYMMNSGMDEVFNPKIRS